ncbi:MAG: hypothetical protein N2D54_10030, partial [Chloroflexota bacterium]
PWVLLSMVTKVISIGEDYWETFEIEEADIELLYNHLLELETPLSPEELAVVLIQDRLDREQKKSEQQELSGGKSYLPKDEYQIGENVRFGMLEGIAGEVVNIRDANSLTSEEFNVIEVEFEGGKKKEFAASFESHPLNTPIEISDDDSLLSPSAILHTYQQLLASKMIEALQNNDEFVYIAGKWFPQALIVDVSVGNLNLAEAILDMAGGGPLPTKDILSQAELPSGVNESLAEFSLDLALQEDTRFDEVGSTGEVLWFLKRLSPDDVLKTTIYLKYIEQDYDRGILTDEMLTLETKLEDELSDQNGAPETEISSARISLIYPHWRAGTLPLSPRLAELFPSAHESPRIRFHFVDSSSGEKFPGWVVRLEKYVFGLRDYYLSKGVLPGSYIILEPGDNPGEIKVSTESHRSNKEWVRTGLIGADGGVVYATLKQSISTSFDDRMITYLPSETDALDEAWGKRAESPNKFEDIVVSTLKDLAKLNPQSHVHAKEVYSAVNVIKRCPPGPILALLATQLEISHVGDLHFRYSAEEIEDRSEF